MFRALANNNMNIHMITTSEIKLSVLVERSIAFNALRVVHNAFELQKPPTKTAKPPSASRTPARKADAVDVVSRLQGVGMEDLMIHDIQLDTTQARVTLIDVPNLPGIAAKIFDRVAEEKIFVDMIVQSFGAEDRIDLSFTVPREQLKQAITVTNAVAKELSISRISSGTEIAKLTVSGVGLRSHTGVAIGMFKALAEAKINVLMVNTSEVRVNVVVELDRGQSALEALNRQFQEAVR
jgi:aspartate kinase